MAREVMPHEAAVRAWLRRARVSRDDADELIQEAYSRLAALDEFEHVTRPDSYFFSITRNLLVRRLKRAKIVPIEVVAELEASDDAPSPEREVGGRLDYGRMLALMALLPERCRRIVEMRKFEGLPQKEIALRLGVTESIVENEIQKGVQALIANWRTEERAAADRFGSYGAGEERRA